MLRSSMSQATRSTDLEYTVETSACSIFRRCRKRHRRHGEDDPRLAVDRLEPFAEPMHVGHYIVDAKIHKLMLFQKTPPLTPGQIGKTAPSALERQASVSPSVKTNTSRVSNISLTARKCRSRSMANSRSELKPPG